MGIGNTSLSIDLLNAATTFVGDVATGASLRLTVGEVYTLQALTADIYIGFGATSALAITDGGTTKGELLAASAPPRVLVVPIDSVVFVGVGGTGSLRVRKAAR
jgi:hypothetical protein